MIELRGQKPSSFLGNGRTSLRKHFFNISFVICSIFLTLEASAQTLISITNPPASVTTTTAGATQFWPNAGTVNGTPVSLRATVDSITGSIALFTSGDNPVVRTNIAGSMATITWEITNTATGAPILADPNFLITDIDGSGGTPNESVSAACEGLTSYTVNGDFVAGCNANSTPLLCQTNIQVSESGGNILAEGTQNQNGSQQEGYMQYSWTGVSSWVVNYMSVTGGRWFVHDADGDVPFDGTEIEVNLVDMATIKGLEAGSLTSPALGEQITFEIEMSNAGPENATGGNLVDTLPIGLNVISATATNGTVVVTQGAPDSVAWSNVNVVVGGSQTLTIVTEVVAPAMAGDVLINETTTALANESVCSNRDVLTYEFVVAETPAPSMTIAKSVSPATSFSAAGDTITYSYLVTNTGNVPIDNVVPTDSGPTFNGAAASNSLVGFTPASATITPGNSQTFTATYLLSQTDVDNMAQDANPLQGIDNTASATGVPVGAPLTSVPNSTVETGFAPDPSLTIVKAVSAATTFDGAGDTITYQYTVSNTGNITINNVVPTDSGPTFNGAPAAGTLSAFTPASASIAPSTNQVFTATYVLDQEDVDNMAAAADPLTAIDNSAGAIGDPEGATPLPPVTESIAETGFAPMPSMTIAKSVSAATTFSQAGDIITYQYEVENTGNVTISSAVPTDAGPTFNGIAATNSLSAFSPASATIMPGDPPEIFTATYILSQQDIDNMFTAADPTTAIDNTASATGSPTGGTLPPVPSDMAETGFAVDAELAISKTAGSPTTGLGANPAATDAGDTITYNFEVTNTGDVTITMLTITDAGPTFNGVAGSGFPAINCPLSTLLPQQVTTCTATYTLSQTDVDNAIIGGVDAVQNSAIASGDDPDGTNTDSLSDDAMQTIAADSSIEVSKSASAPTVVNGADPTLVDPGDTIAYQLDVANTGNTTLSNVLVSDSIATVVCPATTDLGAPFVNDGTAQLAVGDSITCTASYTLLQSDLDAGGVVNTADVTSTDPTGSTIDDDDEVTSGFTQKTSVSLIKSATPLPPVPVAGVSTITYTFELTNTGNVTLTSPQVTDPICASPVSPLTFASGYVSGDGGVVGDMEAGETWIFECDYVIDQDDIDLGEVANTATGSGTPPPGSGLPDPSNTASNLAEADQVAAIALDKSSSLPTVANGALPAATDIGDTIAYTFTVENTGNVSLSNVMVTDPLITGAPNNGTISCGAGISLMAPGDIVICSATYNVTQTDIDAGMVANTANATGTPPPSVPPTDAPEADSSNMVTIAPMPDLDVMKSVAPLTTPLQVGGLITYTFLIENTGNVTINNVVPVDSGPTFNGAAGTNALSAFSPVSANLAPGVSQSFSATYPLSQADIDNIASAADPLTAIDNSATASGAPENGSLPPIDPSETETGAAPNPEVELVKTSTPPVPVVAGADITYNFVLSNTGNVTISSPIVSDVNCVMPGTVLNFASGYVSGDTGATLQALDVGESWTFSCTYPISQTDINAGTVENTATGGGQDPSGDPVEDDSDSNNPGDDTGANDDPTNTPLAQTSAWDVVKLTTSTPMQVGDTLVYQFVINNLGNVDISSVNVVDAKCAAAPVLISGDVGADMILSPPETWTYQCTSVPVTQTEVDDGMVDNEVDVIGSAPPSAPPLPVEESDTSTPIVSAPELTVDKSSTPATIGLGNISSATDPGDVVVYSFDVQNTGNVTIDSLVVNDTGPTFGGNAGTGSWSGVTCPVTTLLPMQSTTCSATYTLSQADIDAAIAAGPGSVANTAEAEGQDPDNNPVTSDTDDDTSSITPAPEVQILKVADAPTIILGSDLALTDPGDTIDFTITVENTGNTTLSNVLVSDSITTVTCPATASPSGAVFTNAGDATSILAVGDSVECTATYVIQQSDINAGQVLNTATVNSTDPSGDPVDDIVDETSPFTQKTSIALTKTASVLPAPPSVGDVVTYTFTLENTGNVTLTGAQVNDPQCETPPGPLTATNGLDLLTDTGSDGLLDAGEIWTFNCDYAIDGDDILAGEITNTATGSGTPPPGSGLDDPSSTSSVLVEAEQNAAITLDKVAGLPTVAGGTLPASSDVGDTVTFTFAIDNTGNLPFDTVTLTDPLITDPPNSGTFTCVLDDGLMTPFTLNSDALPAGEGITCEGVYTLTQADLDNGMVANTATVMGDPPGPIPPPPEATSGSMVPIVPEPSLSILKSASVIPANMAAGDIITYTYEVENTGNVTITNVAPIDLGPTFNGASGTNALSAYSPASITLAPGDSQVFTATYVLSQQDLDNMAAAADPATAIDNQATADGEPAQGSTPPVPPSEVETGVAPSPELELIKSSSVVPPVAAGSVITYTFTLSNTGNVTISNPVINDAMCQAPGGPLSFSSGYVSGDVGPVAQSLDVGEIWQFACDYVVTQANMDAGTVQNIATGSGQDPAGNNVDDDSDSSNPGDDTGGGQDPTNTPLPRTPSWMIDKSTTSVPIAAGDTLTYNFLVTNTGNTSISAITVSDMKCVGGTAILDTASDIGADNILSPAGASGVPAAEQWMYSCVSIPVTQTEMNTGVVINNVTADGTAPGGGLPDAMDEEMTTVTQTPSMSLVKSAGASSLNDDGSFEQVFNFQLKNTGNISLNNVMISDELPAQFGACYVAVAQPGVLSIDDAAPAGDTLNANLGVAPVIAMADDLGVGDSIFVNGFSVTLDPNALGCTFPDPAENTATGSSDEANDVSDNGTDPDTAGPNDSGVPTPFVPPSANPELGIAKSAALLAFNSDFTFDVEYTVLLQNTGDVDITALSLFDDIAMQTGAAFTPSTAADTTGGVLSGPTVVISTDAGPANLVLPNLNAAYHGGAQNLFDASSGYLGVGDIIEVRFSIRLDPTAIDPLPESFENLASGSGESPDGSVVEDESNDGSDPSMGAGGGGGPTVILLEDVAALPIVLGQFSSEVVSESKILVRWQTQTEVANLGFNLFGQIDGDWVVLNPEVIPGKGDSVVLVDYQYTANTTARFLAISDIDAQGKETLHGPFRVGQRYGVETQRKVTDWSEVLERRASKKAQDQQKRRQQMLELNRQRIKQRKVMGE